MQLNDKKFYPSDFRSPTALLKSLKRKVGANHYSLFDWFLPRAQARQVVLDLTDAQIIQLQQKGYNVQSYQPTMTLAQMQNLYSPTTMNALVAMVANFMGGANALGQNPAFAAALGFDPNTYQYVQPWRPAGQTAPTIQPLKFTSGVSTH